MWLLDIRLSDSLTAARAGGEARKTRWVNGRNATVGHFGVRRPCAPLSDDALHLKS